MATRDNRYSQRNWVGFILIILGALFILDTFDIMDFGDTFSTWWPLILIIVGLLKIKGSEKSSGLIFFVLGVIFLLTTLDVIYWSSIWRFWPLILIFIGISMVMRGSRRPHILKMRSAGESSEEFVRASAIFGANEQKIISSNFKGGDIMTLFGGVELDLRQAQVSPEGCTLHVTSIFGGVEILVPPNWDLLISGVPVFGGIESRNPVEDSELKKEKVRVKCTVAFGGVEIK
jgi:predicted membrane protein